jgi:LPS sulfotransferase NodH
MKKSNFVIFTEPRTGSTLLKNILDKQENITCYGELFNKKRGRKILNKVFTKPQEPLLTFLGENQSKWFEKMNIDFKTYLDVVSSISNEQIFGYKIFKTHIKRISNYIPNGDKLYLNFLKESGTKVIILERNNTLLRYISNITARSIGIYSSKINKTEREPKIFQLNPIEINYNSYVQFNERNKQTYAKYLEYVKDYNLPYIHITYEDFTGEHFIESFKRIFDLLDLEFNKFIDLRKKDGKIGVHKKINIYKIEDKVLNYQDFKAEAEKSNDIETLNFLN